MLANHLHPDDGPGTVTVTMQPLIVRAQHTPECASARQRMLTTQIPVVRTRSSTPKISCTKGAALQCSHDNMESPLAETLVGPNANLQGWLSI
jgi:hypothetical protein